MKAVGPEFDRIAFDMDGPFVAADDDFFQQPAFKCQPESRQGDLRGILYGELVDIIRIGRIGDQDEELAGRNILQKKIAAFIGAGETDQDGIRPAEQQHRAAGKVFFLDGICYLAMYTGGLGK